MTHDNKKPETDLEQAIAAVRNDQPEEKEMRAAGERIWARMSMNAEGAAAVGQIQGCADIEKLLPAYAAGSLSAGRALLVQSHLRECVACRNRAHAAPLPQGWAGPLTPGGPRWGFRQFAMAASILIVIGVSAILLNNYFFASPAGMRAKVQSVDGTLYRVSANGERNVQVGEEIAEGEVVRTGGGSHAFVQLLDGSVVEMNERSEFAVTARRRDTTIHLEQGRIIVQAAKRKTGHLYVMTPDARVSVTGTVFSVNSGMKGSRVSVIEGEVHVAHAGINDILHAGDQVATSTSISEVAVRDEIAWSRNLDKHLALLAQFAKLQKKFEQIPTPGLRYSSTILSRVPADTMVYASIPNLGEALSEANRIFQDQLQQSPVLREWWTRGKHQNGGMSFEQMIEKVHALSQYLGDEVTLVAVSGQSGGEADAVVMAEVRRSGLREFLQTEFTMGSSKGNKPEFKVVDEEQLRSMPANAQAGQLMALVRPDVVLFSCSARSLQRLSAQLGGGSGAFTATEFGRRVSDAYSRGAGFLLAADLQKLMAHQGSNADKDAQKRQREREEWQRTGFADARYLIAEHRELSGVPDNRAVLDFTGQRQGIASWLASPASMGSLEYVSANAGIAVSFVTKSPALMLDDIMQIAAASDKDPKRGLADAEAKLGVNLRDDLAATLGGDVTFALDGPILPKPSWKLIAEVNDPARLQNSLQRLTDALNREAAQHGRPGVQLDEQQANGRTFYVLHALDPRAAYAEIDYTFADGFMIAAPSRALVMNALRTRANGDSLARSSAFQSILPKDGHANFSALVYQNLAPVIDPIKAQLTASQLQALQEVAGSTKPTVICAYGDESSIEVASASTLFPFDLNRMAFTALLGGSERHGRR